jgi:hypothetical protein
MIDHDQLFKKLLREFFLEFVEVFLPAAWNYLDPTGIEFLDKELFTDLPLGEKRDADLVVKVRFKGQRAYFLIHVEPERARRRKRGEFAWRMFDYFALLTRDHHLPVYPVALLSYDKPRNLEADTFRVEFPDKTVLEFRFTVIQPNRLNWRDYLRHDNPAAAALMAKMGIAPEDRVEVKKECLRMIARLRIDREKTKFLARFVDTYLRLDAKEEEQFNAAIKKLPREEKEAAMELMTSWEEKGLQQGLQREREFILRLLEQQVGTLSKRLQATLKRLPIEQLESLGEAAIHFNDPRDLTRWLRQHVSPDNGARRR